MSRPIFPRVEKDLRHWAENLLRELDGAFTTDGPGMLLCRQAVRMNVPLVGAIDGVNDTFTCNFTISRDPEANPYALVVVNGLVVPFVLNENPQQLVLTTPPGIGADVSIAWLICRI